MPDTKRDIITTIERALDRLTLRSVFIRRKTVYSPQGLAYASFHRRLVAAGVDALILMFAMLPFNNAIIAYVYKDVVVSQEAMEAALANVTTQAEANLAMFRLQMEAGFAQAFAHQLEIQYLVMAVYSFFFWRRYAATPGKLLLGMRIVDVKTGARITALQSVFRIAAYAFSGVFFMLGFLAVAISRKKRGWHDVFAGTAVVVAISAPRSADPSDSQGSTAAE